MSMLAGYSYVQDKEAWVGLQTALKIVENFARTFSAFIAKRLANTT